MFPKPKRPERGTARARDYMAKVAQLPCVCCGARPVQCHHPIHGRFAQRKSSDLDVIPLCPAHHDMLHKSPYAWRSEYGDDTDHIEPTREAVRRLGRNTI